jgi:hypothetical protein
MPAHRLLPFTRPFTRPLLPWPGPLLGQAFAPSHCHWLCSPSAALMPAVIRAHLFGGPLVSPARRAHRGILAAAHDGRQQ